MRDIKHIVIHCSASKNGDGRVTAEVIDGWHRAKGWKKIGYHYVIATDGTLEEGRPVEQVGAHVEGHNGDSIGICVVGTDRFSLAQWGTLADLVRVLQGQHPDADVLGHRDYSPDLNGDGIIEPWEWMKTCPGFDVRAWITEGMAADWNPMHLFDLAAA